MAPIDYIYGAGILNSLIVGTGNIIYCAFANKPASSIKTPMKYTIISSNTLGGAACGALVIGLGGWVISTIGTSGESPNDKTNKIVSNYTKVGAATGAVIGGAGGAAFGFCVDKLIYSLVETTLQTMPREVIVGATIATAGLLVGTAAYQYTKSYFHNDINDTETELAGEQLSIEDTPIG